MAEHDLRAAIDAGDVDLARAILAGQAQLATRELVWRDGSGEHLSAPIGYVSIARFHGLADHQRMGEITRLLLAAGAPVDGDPGAAETPLITAASYGETDVARALIEGGADLEATGFAVPDGTALAHAVHYGNPEVADLLVAAGATRRTVVDAAGCGDLTGWPHEQASPADRASALRAAAVCERLEVIDALIDAGTPVDAEADEGGTALHWAAFHGKPAAVRHLIERGADVDRRDPSYGASPLGWCRHRGDELYRSSPGHESVARYLEPLTTLSP